MTLDTDLARGGLAEPTLVQPAQVASVYTVRVGATLAAALGSGATTITVDDADDFVDEGGTLALASADDLVIPPDVANGIPGFTDRPNTDGIRYVSVDRATNVLTLAVAWDASFPTYDVGDAVWVDPPSIERRADVALDGDLQQTVAARLPHSLAPTLPEGIRIEGEGEWVEVRVTDTGYELVDVLNEPAVIEADAVLQPEGGSDVTYSTITADVVESPSVPRRNPAGLTLYVDQANGSDENGGEALFPLLDTFERSVVSGFGTSDSGHVWSQIVSGAISIDVGQLTAGSARIRTNAAGAQQTIMRSAFAPLDVEVSGVLNANQLVTAGSHVWGIAARIADSQNIIGVGFLQTGTRLDAVIESRRGGAWTTDAEVQSILTGLTSPTLAATELNVRAQFVTNPDGGTDVLFKWWVGAAAEPDDWMLTYNNSAGAGLQSAGGVGVYTRTGSAFTGNVSGQWRSLTATTVGGDGLPVDVAAGGVGPLASIAAALVKVGDWNEGECRIILAGTIEEDVEVAGLGGGGSVVIDGGNLAATLFGYVRCRGVVHRFELARLNLIDSGTPGPVATVMSERGSGYVLLTACKIDAKSLRANVVQYSEGARGTVDDCDVFNATARGIYAVNAAVVRCVDCRGSGSTTSYQASAAVMFVSGTKPNNATNVTVGGQIFGTTSSNSGGSAPPDPQPTKKTFTVTANATRTWRPEWAWREDNDECYQGEWQGSGGLSRGCAFYGTKTRKSGATAVSGKVYVKRQSSGGNSGKQDVYVAVHNLEKQPSGDTGPNIVAGPSRVGALGYGEGAWFSLPKSYVQALLTGGGRGVMLYHGSASPYIICLGRKNGSGMMKLSLTYLP